ncbi:DUF4868 domain-containing protein [Staphylococcus aureus]|nr:Kiwa anti-phage protein KwaB-like domain-containing protein [Staphylococcus aureus]QOY78898.1 DUF4868 domain-containing protein [Staphylococcus aureus]
MLKNLINNNLEAYLHFIFNKNIEQDLRYISLPISNEFVDDLRGICIAYVNKILNTNNIDEYNIIGVNDNVIESYDLDANVMQLPRIDNIFIDENRLNNIPNEEFENYTFFVIETSCNGESSYFVRKPSKPSVIKKGTFITKDRDRYKLYKENEFIAFDDKIDFVLDSNRYYIFRRNAFEYSFDFEPIYDYLTYEVFENSVLKEKIENYDELFIDINEDKSLKKRVASLCGKQSTTLFLEQLDVTERINNDYGLNLNFENGNLIYEEKSQAKHIVAFMQDAYYETYLGGEQGTDTRR